uniref:HDC15809 n=1 Tax=Drosophila melanogaster TaxID=7227 RepID=Q6IJ61_DROME|nr:TPA_inf: HDC15809 [Drosophila melanogaster]
MDLVQEHQGDVCGGDTVRVVGCAISSIYPPPKRSTKKGARLHSRQQGYASALATAPAAAAALSQTKAARDAKAFRGKHVGKVLQVLQISLAALACGWPQKPMELELELELEVAKSKVSDMPAEVDRRSVAYGCVGEDF